MPGFLLKLFIASFLELKKKKKIIMISSNINLSLNDNDNQFKGFKRLEIKGKNA